MRSLRRPSPALVVSMIALFVSLSGTGYAAITITGKNVKDASLTGKDVKNGSLASGDVKNGSLVSGDFKAGAMPVGPTGPTGTSGPQGPAGQKGAPGDPASVAGYGGTAAGINLLDASTVVSKTLPAGKYLLTASADVQNGGSSNGYMGGTTPVSCSIPGYQTETYYLSVNGVYFGGQMESFSLNSAITHPGGQVKLSCSTTWNTAYARKGSLNAVRVGSID